MNKINTTTFAAGIIGFALVPCFGGTEPMPSAPIAMDESAVSCGLRGSLAITAGNTWLNDDGGPIAGGEEDEFLSTMVELRLGMDFNRIYGQLDVIGEITDADSTDSYRSGWGSAMHLMYQLDNFGLGVFGGWFRTDQDDDGDDTSDRFLVGIEGLHEAAGLDIQWQLGGLLGNGGDDDSGLDSLRDVYFGRIAVSKALGNGWSVGGDAVAAQGAMDDDRDDLRIYGLGLHVEKQIGSSLEVGLVYQGNYYDQRDEDESITEHFVGLNATWYFGGASDNEECRPNLGLPPVLRWMGLTGGQLE